MKKLQNLSFTFILLFIANLSFSQDVAEKKSSKNLINTDSISSLNPYIEDHTDQLNIKMIVSNNQLKYFSGPEWIRKYILNDKFVFVVSGTHGKTTTTSMLIKILQENNLDPSYILGGIHLEEKISYKFNH